jgi:cell division control protein 24
VDDWKNHRVDHFGDLLLHGHFPVVTGKSDVQKVVRPHSIRRPSIANFRATVDSTRKALVSKWHWSGASSPGKEAANSEWEVVSVREPPNSFDQCPLSIVAEEDLFLGDMIFHHFSGCHPVTGDPFLAEKFANSLGIICPHYEQYTIYLFERILLCCKEVNPNKSKEKLMGTQKDKKDKKDKSKNKEPNKNAKLQLKGRIFMTNVTEVLSLAKQGN